MSKPTKSPKSPYYQYDIQIDGARFHGSTKCKTFRDAERFIENLRKKVALGEAGREQLNVNQACGLWWDAKGQHLRANKTEEYRLANLVSGLGAATVLSRMTLRDWDAYVAQRRSKGLSVSSINREVQLARRVWNFAVSRDYAVKMPKWGEILGKEPQERIRELSPDEEARLFQHLPASLAGLVEFALLSGQRKAEVVGLRWADCDLVGKRATVVIKGGNRHTFPLTGRMIAILKEQTKAEGVDEVFTYECTRPSGSRKEHNLRIVGQRYPYSNQGWKGQWGRALEAAGITNFRFHDLRHTAATRVVRASGSLKAAQLLLGHTEIKTTARYAHATADDVMAAMEKAQSQHSPVLVDA